MRSGNIGKAHFPQSLKNFRAWLKNIYPDIRPDTSRLLVEFSGSQTEKLDTSSYNSTHAEWVMNQVVTALKNQT